MATVVLLYDVLQQFCESLFSIVNSTGANFSRRLHTTFGEYGSVNNLRSPSTDKTTARLVFIFSRIIIFHVYTIRKNFVGACCYLCKRTLLCQDFANSKLKTISAEYSSNKCKNGNILN